MNPGLLDDKVPDLPYSYPVSRHDGRRKQKLQISEPFKPGTGTNANQADGVRVVMKLP